MHLPLRLLVIIGAPMLCLIGLVGAFADDANTFERILLAGLNPVAAIGAAWSVFGADELDPSDDDPAENARPRRWVTGLAVAALIGNLLAAMAIAIGWSSGDFELPLIFAVPFVAYLGLVFAQARLR